MTREMTALGFGDGMRLKARIEHAVVGMYRAVRRKRCSFDLSVCGTSMNCAVSEVFCVSRSARTEGKLVMLDKALRQTIVHELDCELSADAANIGVAVDNGVVTLTGHPASYAGKAIAERTVQRGKGVRAIAEKIVVRYPINKQTADDQIAERALTVAVESRARARIRASRLQRYQELSATTA
jgi:hypothetical protein